MSNYDPSAEPRRLGSGYKGDGWVVSIPPDGNQSMLLLDTGHDSVVIVRIPNGKWDRSARPEAVHAHIGYDETIVVSKGSGTVFHGPDPDHIVATRFEGNAIVVVPAGAWHHVSMKPQAIAVGTSFFTLSGMIIEPFARQMEVATQAKVDYGKLPIVRPRRVDATIWRGTPAVSHDRAAQLIDAEPNNLPSPVRILPFKNPARGHELAVQLDTGHDSLFILAAPSAKTIAPPGQRISVEPPEFHPVHSHPDVDEYIVYSGNAGYLLNGPTPASVTRTPFRGPCVIVMPAGALHKIAMTEFDAVNEPAILVYAHRHAVVEPYETIMARTLVATFGVQDKIGATS